MINFGKLLADMGLKFNPMHFSKLAQFGGLKSNQVTPEVIGEVLGMLGMKNPEPGLLEKLSHLIVLNDEETFADWLGSTENLEKLRDTISPPDQGPPVVLCPHCSCAFALEEPILEGD